MKTFWKNLPYILLVLAVTLYGTYFSLFTIQRYNKMYTHYFDLGIMHQTVYNTYKGIQTGDMSRVLELTNPHQKPDQIKRMAVHNDILLALLAPFYFIYSGPETLLVIQSVITAIGAIFLFFIAREVLHKYRLVDWLALLFSVCYLLYFPLQKGNTFEFHAVTLSTTFLLIMYYSYLKKRFGWGIAFALLSLFSKEEVGLTLAFFGAFILFEEYRKKYSHIFSLKNIKKYTADLIHAANQTPIYKYSLFLIIFGIGWAFFSLLVIIPYFRGGEHFAANYFHYLFENPWLAFYVLADPERINYLKAILSPVAFLSVLSPIHLFIVLPELMVNLLSSSEAMRNTYFHYNSVIIPFIFIAAIYGFNNGVWFFSKYFKMSVKLSASIIVLLLLISTIRSSVLYSTLPYGNYADKNVWKSGPNKREDVLYWQEKLKDDRLKVSATGDLAPFFTSRRYFYDFNYTYPYADYVILDSNDAMNGFMKKFSRPAYVDLKTDSRYTKIYDRNEIEVYKKL